MHENSPFVKAQVACTAIRPTKHVILRLEQTLGILTWTMSTLMATCKSKVDSDPTLAAVKMQMSKANADPTESYNISLADVDSHTSTKMPSALQLPTALPSISCEAAPKTISVSAPALHTRGTASPTSPNSPMPSCPAACRRQTQS